ncbi:hypothetical protein GJAV_G00071800 [Gymnothorax javanicus]|nr:hypothetical protein GJAV_G00071800 [Gymnothorax javanicus]
MDAAADDWVFQTGIPVTSYLTPTQHIKNSSCQRGTERIGVYLDHRAGTLSFYSITSVMTLLHRVQTTFTQPLYPGFGFCHVGSSVKLCDL